MSILFFCCVFPVSSPMALTAHWQKHTLQFRFEAGTSRGTLTTKDTWYLILTDAANPTIQGIGECGPLKGLSPDDRPDLEQKLENVCRKISTTDIKNFSALQLLDTFSLHEFPSILFGLETASADLKNGGTRIIFNSGFSKGETSIPINGLVWMGNESFMQQQIEDKLKQGYNCIKLKIGAIDFDTEVKLIESIRKHFSEKQITIRVDANGAFDYEEARTKLKILSRYSIHSIEQPIKAGLQEQMKALCEENLLPIALDEEIIGIMPLKEKKKLLEFIRPPYIILKPTLVGGMEMSLEWIRLAEQMNIGWWITSALESNIGLNAIAQFTASLNPALPQGLGTGQLYHNNIDSPLTIHQGNLYYQKDQRWNLTIFS